MILLANLVAAIKIKMNKAGRSQIMADRRSWLFKGGTGITQVKLKDSEQKHRTPYVTNGIQTLSQCRFSIHIVTEVIGLCGWKVTVLCDISSQMPFSTQQV